MHDFNGKSKQKSVCAFVCVFRSCVSTAVYYIQVVLPAGHLQDVMKSVISNDERMQEATVSVWECVSVCEREI